MLLPARDGARTITAALASIRAQSLGDWEAVVVDDGSSDDTALIVTRLAAFDARIRLVGKTTPVIDALHRPPSVTVVGSVPAMDPELAGADIAVVPLRIASGTRLKILESFAHRIPVVSTTLGAEGLDVTDGVHLLLADDADAFAAACHRLLVDAALRARLADAAEDLYLRRYQWSTAEGAVERLVHDVIGVSTAP